jgi:hypothetical protein
MAFVQTIRDGGAPAVSGEEAVASLEVAIRCLEQDSGASLQPHDAQTSQAPEQGATV